MSRAGIGGDRVLSIDDVDHAPRAAVPRLPLFLSRPTCLNVAGGPPQVAANFRAPQPRLVRSPLADAQHKGARSGVERIPHVRKGSFRVLRARVAPLVLQVIDTPSRIL